MKKLILIALLGATVSSAWGAAARPELKKAPLSPEELQILHLRIVSNIQTALDGQVSKKSDALSFLIEARKYANDLNDGGRGLSWVNLAESAYDDSGSFNSKRFYDKIKPALLKSGFPVANMDEIMKFRSYLDKQ